MSTYDIPNSPHYTYVISLPMKRVATSSLSDDGGHPLKAAKKDCKKDCLSALHYLESLYAKGVFGCDPALPTIVLKHQLYSLHDDRTLIDREVIHLRDSGIIRIFKLGLSEQDYVIVEEDEYCSYLQAFLKDHSLLLHKLMDVLLPKCKEVSISQQLITTFGVTESQVSALVRLGVLLPRDVGKKNKSWWLAIPSVSPFVKSLVKGRSAVQQIVKRSKFNELLWSELETRKLGVSKLPVEYHIHDLVGSDQLERVTTTSGPLLRILATTQQR